ncbi:MAG: glycine zipper domain-containing protein [Rickettsiales bacterium]
MFSTATKDAANDTVADAKSTAYNAKRDVREAARSGRNDVTDYAEKAGHEVRKFIDDTTDQMSDARERLTNEIHDHPLRSSAVALGIGVLLGALIRR